MDFKITKKDNEALDLFRGRASELIGKEFIFDDHNQMPTLLAMLHYKQDKRFEEVNGMSLNKGIVFFGPVGSGKSIIFKTMQSLLPYPLNFPIRSDFELRLKFSREGYGNDYDGVAACMRWPKLVIDDIGTSTGVSSHFSQKSDITTDIITARYERRLFGGDGKFTHITTNLKNIEEIGEYFGDRIASRMHEMFNFIFVYSDHDRRKK